MRLHGKILRAGHVLILLVLILPALGGCAETDRDVSSCAANGSRPGAIRVALGDFDPALNGTCVAGRLQGSRLLPFEAVRSAPVAQPLIAHPETPSSIAYSAAAFSSLPGWGDDGQGAALSTFRASCARIMKKQPDAAFGNLGRAGEWQSVCRSALSLNNINDSAARGFFETQFKPWRVAAGGEDQGLFTGYYEIMLDGARTRSGTYATPLRAMPDDMVTLNIGDFLPVKPRRLTGRVEGNWLKPYPDRRVIGAGGLAKGEDRPLVWVNDPIRAFFLQVQGSGVVRLADASLMRVGYAGQNGRPYKAIGAELVRQGVMTKAEVSLQSITVWLRAHPAEAARVMDTNPSYVFFRVLPGAGDAGPPGAEGVDLTPGRSMAVDRTLWPYGMLSWVDASPVQAGEAPFRRLMVAQDTGGAIVGALRGDIFWGRGEDAERNAGMMKSPGRMWVLLPRYVRPNP